METKRTDGRALPSELLASPGSAVDDVLFRQIVQGGNQGLWVLDHDGGTIFANDAMATMLGYTVADMMALSLLDFLDEDGHTQGVDFLARQRETGGTRDTSDTMFLRRDGMPIWTSINHGPWLTDDGHYRGLIFFVTDVTNRRRLHEELQQREDQLADAQRVAGLGSWEWDIASDEVRWSDQLYRMFGFAPNEVSVTLQRYLDMLHPEDRHLTIDAVASCMNGSPGFELDQRVVRHDGKTVWVRASGELLRAADGQPTLMRGSALGITAFKEAETALTRTTARYQLLQTMASAANGANGLAEVVELAVREMCAHQQWPAGRAYLVAGGPPGALQPADWSFNPEQPGSDTPSSPGPGEMVIPVRALATRLAVEAFSTGQPHWSSPAGPDRHQLGSPPGMNVDFAFPLQYEGRVVAVLEFVTDGTVRPADALELCEQVGTQLVRVAEREVANRELMTARDSALEAAQAKSAFLATMSHEIRTPMNGVIGLTDLLLGTELTDRQRQYAEGVQGAGEALLAIINDILDFSKIEAGKLELEVIDFDVTQIIEEVASLLARQAHSKGLELIAHASLGLSTAVRGDPARLRQVLLNLTSNGIKFTEQGDVMLRAWIVAETDTDAQVRFEVSDTGMGIGPADQQRLFQAFSQVDASTTRRFGGTGLGLAISTQLVEAMGGLLTVVSAVGQGSTFTFTLSLARGDSLRGPATLPDDHLLRGVPVLVVGGSATNRLILHEQLAGWDMVPQLATSGAAALQLLHNAVQHRRPMPVALIDLSLPGMSGLELARRIRQDPTLAQTRLVILTPTDATDDASQSLVFAHLSKPVRYSQLYDCLQKALAPATTDTRLPAHADAAASAQHPVVLGRLLVAEDNATNQLVARAMLGRLGYRVDIAANGLEALAALERTDYAAVLMDCQMPEMDGYTATEAIRRLEVRSGLHIPVIAITAGAFEGDQERCLAAGMDDYIAKPIKLVDLENVLNKWVSAQP